MTWLTQWLQQAYRSDDHYTLISWLFLRILGGIYAIAFFSLAVQILGLVGTEGILPFHLWAERAYSALGPSAWWHFPTLFWFNSSDIMLFSVCLVGGLLSTAVMLGWQRQWVMVLLFVFYLSLTRAGQIFLNFQWDYLLLESGFLAIFLLRAPSALVIFLFHWLLFRLRFFSGIAKLASGDPSWSGFNALNYYFETQPLPHIGSWYAHQLPALVHQAGVAFTFFSELIVPFFIFLPRPFRLTAAGVTLVMQLLIIMTSNHNWINLLTIALCIFLLQDRDLQRIIPVRIKQWAKPAELGSMTWSEKGVLTLAAGMIVFSSVTLAVERFSPFKLPVATIESALISNRLGIGNIYHVFPTMQTERQELEIQGSMDGVHWKTYEFRYKPGDIAQAPRWVVPHQPRLDWMIWFVTPQFPEQLRWFDRFMQRLAEGAPAVTDLLRHNPFPNEPPRYLRVLAYQYHFTNFKERAKTGHWWKRELLGEFPHTPPRFP